MKIIRLTDSRNKELVLVNLDHVVSILNMSVHTSILLTTGTTISIYETPEEIWSIITTGD